MSTITKWACLGFSVASAYIVYILLFAHLPIPVVEDEYWGPSHLEKGQAEDESIIPFSINVSTEIIEDLQARLKRELSSNRLTSSLESVAFNYGVDSDFVEKVGQYWMTKYKWSARETLLNKYPHFRTKIGGLDIHFQHIKPKSRNGQSPRPLLVIHGWPGSFVEFQKIIPVLAEPENYKHNYELIIPSLPGFGFSSAAARRGMNPTVVANIFKRLMKRLGHDKFFVMGGDWGAIITADIATVYPENVIAAQSNMCFSLTLISHARYNLAILLQNVLMSSDERKLVLPPFEFISFVLREFGYFHIQATKPDTIGVALTQSPLGLAAYVLEKFSTWTNRTWVDRKDGGVLDSFSMDELLDNVMIYWATGSITSSMRLYAEFATLGRLFTMERVSTNVPFSCQYMPGDFIIYPQFALHDKFTNIQKFSIASVGGHFGAFEKPMVVAENAISHFESCCE